MVHSLRSYVPDWVKLMRNLSPPDTPLFEYMTKTGSVVSHHESGFKVIHYQVAFLLVHHHDDSFSQLTQ